MNLFSRPNSPFALWLATNAAPIEIWNGREVPAFAGFSDSDTQIIWEQVRQAWKWWNVDVVAGNEPTKPYVGIGFSNVFGNEPGGGQANPGTWQQGGIQAYVFVDVNQNNPYYCGWDAVHESGHVMGTFTDMIVNGVYQLGWWMGMPVNNPQWTMDQRQILDSRFGMNADLDFNQTVNIQDAEIMRQGQFTENELINLARQVNK